VDLHACEWGQLAALGHSADLMFGNSVRHGTGPQNPAPAVLDRADAVIE
jgi:hypothetical protein